MALRPLQLLVPGAISLFLGLSFFSGASAATAGHEGDEAAIRTQADEYARAFERGDIEKLASYWYEGAAYADQYGNLYKGRELIKDEYKKFFETNSNQKIKLDFKIESIEFPDADSAVETGLASMSNSRNEVETCRYIATHYKQNGRWMIETVSEYPYRAENNGDNLKALSWLLGDWKATGPNGSELKIKLSWANKNVISMDCVSNKDPEDRETEFIFWNPESRKINSWQFDGKGGTSRAWWDTDGKVWVINSISIQADGSRSSAKNFVWQVDKDNFIWQSKSRRLAGFRLPDTEEIKVTRAKS